MVYGKCAKCSAKYPCYDVNLKKACMCPDCKLKERQKILRKQMKGVSDVEEQERIRAQERTGTIEERENVADY
jgi:hypothetical protein